MQTFLIEKNFYSGLIKLDYRRLGKQRVEAFQLWLLNNKLQPSKEFSLWLERFVERTGKRNLLEANTGWQNHPAAKMWRGYNDLLAIYTNTAIKAWIDRGYNNTMEYLPVRAASIFVSENTDMSSLYGSVGAPIWLTDSGYAERFYSSHRSNLLRKNKEYYSQFNWSEDDNQEYLWPASGFVL